MRDATGRSLVIRALESLADVVVIYTAEELEAVFQNLPQRVLDAVVVAVTAPDLRPEQIVVVGNRVLLVANDSGQFVTLTHGPEAFLLHFSGATTARMAGWSGGGQSRRSASCRILPIALRRFPAIRKQGKNHPEKDDDQCERYKAEIERRIVELQQIFEAEG